MTTRRETLEELIELVEKHGAVIRRAKHGVIWRLPGNGTCMISNSIGATDRGKKFAERDLRLALRAAGLIEQQEEAPAPEPVEEKTMHKAIHKQVNKKVKRIVTVETEVVIGFEAVAQAAEIDEHSNYTIEDVNGTVLEFPLTIRLREVKEEDAA